MSEPKRWQDRDFDECCYAVSGIGNDTMVCAAPCRGSYCTDHRDAETGVIAAFPSRKRGSVRTAMVLPAPSPVAAQRVAQIPSPKLAEIVAIVAEIHGVTVSEIVGPNKATALSPARQEASWLLKRQGASWEQAARALGKTAKNTKHHARAYAARLEAAGASL